MRKQLLILGDDNRGLATVQVSNLKVKLDVPQGKVIDLSVFDRKTREEAFIQPSDFKRDKGKLLKEPKDKEKEPKKEKDEVDET